MITINNKSRYFSASEDMFPTMERNFAWLFGMQTPEQAGKVAWPRATYRSARAGAEMERQYGFPIGDDGEPMLFDADFLADLMAAYLEILPDVAPQTHSFEERRAMMKRAFPPQTHQGVLRDPPRQRDEREPRVSSPWRITSAA